MSIHEYAPHPSLLLRIYAKTENGIACTCMRVPNSLHRQTATYPKSLLRPLPLDRRTALYTLPFSARWLNTTQYVFSPKATVLSALRAA